MGLINIPTYAYIDGTTRYNVVQLITDDVIYNKLDEIFKTGSYGGYSQFVSWSDVNTTEPDKIINDYFGSHLISNKLKFYCANTIGTVDLSVINECLGLCKLSVDVFPYTTDLITKLVTLDNVLLYNNTGVVHMGSLTYNDITHNYTLKGTNFFDLYSNQQINISEESEIITLDLVILPEDVIQGDSINGMAHYEHDNYYHIEVRFRCDTANDWVEDISISFHGVNNWEWSNLTNYFDGVEVDTPGTVVDDLENPYGYEGTSGSGGGHGKYGDIDGIEPTDIPDLPTINAASLGLITLYNPSAVTINSLANYLWSGMFDPDTFKKLFADPMGCMIGLSIVPATSGTGGSKNIKFGNTDTGINCSYLTSNYCSVDCGSLSIDEYVGSFMDYEPYCKISIFLPYIGFRDLSADDLMGGSINVVYHIDVLSGNCIAFIHHSVKGVMYSYSGTCITNIPLTAQSFSSALQSYYTGLAGVLGTAIGGMGSGMAGLAATGGQLASTAMNQLFNSKPTFQRSGSSGGASGIMGVQTPFLIIQRPRFSVPYNIQYFAGQTSNMTMNLGDCSGFTMVEHCHLDGLNATTEEITEIEIMLKAGVIL